MKTTNPVPDGSSNSKSLARLIAFYLPQFHPIEENDRWWGKGFTEWTNVAQAGTRFEGHYQPRIPGELGFYDLRLAETRIAQADLARAHGIEAFCYWHYWFNGRRILQRPFQEVLATGRPDFGFCLAWANENWTRRWDGQESEILLEQTYGGADDDRAHFRSLLPAFRDPRAFRIDDKPVFLIYRPAHLPDVRRTIDLWRELAREAGLPGLHLIAIVTCFDVPGVDWTEKGFDAKLCFQPDFSEELRQSATVLAETRDKVVHYADAWPLMSRAAAQGSTETFGCVTPSWDNSARRKQEAFIIHNSTPAEYGRWLRQEISRVQDREVQHRVVFINAWNEWAEGNHLEPDLRWGSAYLEETLRANERELSTELIKDSATSPAPQILDPAEDEAREPHGNDAIVMCAAPAVSVIIPVLNKIALTTKCLEALRQNTPAGLCEVIIWDNASTDGTQAFFQQLTAVDHEARYFRSEENLGFVGGNNAAARHARGRFLVFLNNDTEPRPGWLEALLQTIEADPTIGAVGAKLIYPNGQLQEAGGIIFQDASGWNYGRTQDPRDPRFNFPREVDYCSAACLLVRAELFGQLGGFDARYAPAYYEDTDLCFALRQAGYKVVYQPRCEVIHHEGATAGQHLNQGFKRYQAINRQKFFDKWKTVLANQSVPDPALARRASHRVVGQRILIVDPFLPMYDRASGSRRLFEIVKLLVAGGNAVTFIARNGHNGERYVAELEKMGVEVYAGDAERMRECGCVVKSRPLDLQKLLQETRYDVIILSFWYVAEQYLSRIRAWSPASRVLIDTVDVHFVREHREAELSQDAKLFQQAEKTRRGELAIYRQADALITVTEDDRQTLLRELPECRIFVAPNIHDLEAEGPGAESRDGLLFVGNFGHRPNEDAVLYFHREIWPLVLQRVPGARWAIVGNNPPPSVQTLAGGAIQVTGYVPSVEPYLRSHLVSVAPLRYGAGMKGKIGEALACGLPVVTTSVGVEGMGLKNGENGALVADDPEAFAAQIAKLYADRQLWNELSAQGRRHIETHFTPQCIERQLKTILDWSASFTSIVILAHNQLPDTQQCLASIEKHTTLPHELILVDNGSTDGTGKFFRAYAMKHHHVRVILNRSNQGFSAGNNQALACAGADAIVLLNNDTVVTPGWLENMRGTLNLHPDCGLVGPVSNYVSGPQCVAADYASLDQLPGFAAAWRADHAGQSAEAPRLVGFCLLLRRAVLEKIGGLDPQFGSGNFEDDDFCLRAAWAGFKLRIALDSFVHHTGSQTFKGAKIDYRASMERNWELFKTKWGLPKDAPLDKGYPLSGLVLASSRLHQPLPKLGRSHTSTLEGRCWVDKMLPVTEAKKDPPKPVVIVPPPCAQVGRLQEARELTRKKQWPAAWTAAVSALSSRPFHPEAYLLLAEIALAAGNADSARHCAKAAREMAPDWAPAKQFLKGNLRGQSKLPWLKFPPVLAGEITAPRVSVCLIAKNEEQFISQCLRSIRALASQIIVVDTGSTDRTIEIAREFGAEVHSIAWRDDFSAARNAALEHATGDWVLFLDCDEELMPDKVEALAREIRAPDVLGYRLPIIDRGREEGGCNYVQRLFRNAPGLYFVGRIHEQIFSTINARCKQWGLKNVLGQTALLHHGYTSAVVASRNKIERNLKLLERAVAEMPGEPTFIMNLGLELVRSGQLEAGLDRYWEAFRLVSSLPESAVTPEGRETLLTQLSTYLMAARRFSEIVQLWQIPFANKGGLTASQHFCLGVAQMELQQFAEAAGQMRQCLAKRHLPGLAPINLEILKAGPYHCLALCLSVLNDAEGALHAFEAALAADPSSRVVRFDLARHHAGQGRTSEALDVLRQLVAENPTDLQAWGLGGLVALSQPEHLACALDWTGHALQHYPDDNTLLRQRAEALLLNQDVAAALPVWRRVMANASRQHRGAVVLCELLTEDRQYHFTAGEEPAISQDVVQWYRQCIRMGAHGIIHQLHERMDAIRLILPGFVRVCESAHRQARLAAA
jgi:GT2 family glycosyltransferase/tetratricopeptide (TPR) repeat protein